MNLCEWPQPRKWSEVFGTGGGVKFVGAGAFYLLIQWFSDYDHIVDVDLLVYRLVVYRIPYIKYTL